MKNDYTVLPISEYLDKTTAGFLGQLVGFFSGYEFVFTQDGKARVAMPDEWFEMCNGPYANPNPHKAIPTSFCLTKKAACGKRGMMTITV